MGQVTGNMHYGSNAIEYGAIGKDADKFAIYPDYQTGYSASTRLLQSSLYRDLTLGDAIKTYAPSNENNTAAYQRFMNITTGINLTVRMDSLTHSQINSVANSIQRYEGYEIGTIIHYDYP